MTQVQAVRSAQHAQYSWQPYTDYGFARADSFAPLLVHEFILAGAVAPIAFTETAGAYSPVQMMGLHNGTNLLVSPTGKWLGHYVPAYYRSHPFCMAKAQDGKTLLSVRSDSEHVLDHYTPGNKTKPFFKGDELSAELQAVREFLVQVEASRRITQSFCIACAENGLFVPWDLKLNTGQQTLNIKGLHRIDEAKLKALPAETAKSLLANGALGAIYYHLASLQHTQILVKLKQRQDGASSKANGASPLQDMLAPDPAEPIDLDWNAIVKSES